MILRSRSVPVSTYAQQLTVFATASLTDAMKILVVLSTPLRM
jgi:hypothetical protein